MPTDARFVSQSELKTFRRCRRKWWLLNIRRLEFDYPPSPGHRRLGTIVHAGLEAYYAPLTYPNEPKDAYDRVQALHDEDSAKITAWCHEHAELSGGDPQLMASAKLESLAKETDLALIMLQGYFDWLEESAVDALLRPTHVEQEIEVPFTEHYGREWHLVGKLDLRAVREDNGFTAFLDHKTVANLTDIPKQAAQNEQGLMYNVLLRLLTGEHVDGEIINMLRKVKRTSTAKPPFYGRHEVRWNSHQLNSFYERITGLVREMALAEAQIAAGWSHQQVAPPNPTGDCSWDCDFYAVCGMFDDGSRVEDALANHYRVHDPLARYKVLHQETETEGTPDA